MIKRFLSFIIAVFSVSTLVAQSGPSPADLLVFNARIYTVDAKGTVASAMIVRNGRVLATGSREVLLKTFLPKTVFNAQGKFIYPGFIDAHAHFYRYALGLSTASLFGTTSWADILTKLQDFAPAHPDGWLLGRGWDQNDWPTKEFPVKDELDRLFPDRPVLLTRVDGHALIANARALQIAGITSKSRVEGGSIELKDGEPTGVLIDNAMDLLWSKVPMPDAATRKELLARAENNCFAVGLTTVDDCGLDREEISFMDSLQKEGLLHMRIYAMLSDARKNYEFLFKRGVIKTARMHVRSFKVYADGALGSRGACLLQPYNDRPDWSGFLLSSLSHFDSVASIIRKHNFQMCTHAIGDSGNRAMLHIYARNLKGNNDQRWRIEHAQVISPQDFALFGRYSIIPSVQPTHATSDMYWAKERLGDIRVRGAYANQQLLQQNGWLPLGTDFPVEDISPLKTFFAAVARQDAQLYPARGFQPENALTREQALRGMTIWAAKANFEEKEKGSLEKGKLADFVILDTDLLTAPLPATLNAKVLSTWQDGKRVYEQK